MGFRNFIERNDLPLMQSLHADTQKSIEALIEHYRKFYALHFRARKRGEDEHDYFMELRGVPERWRSQFPYIHHYRISIHPRSSGQFASLTGSELGGEIIDDFGHSIILYSSEIYSLVSKLEDLANGFAWSMHDHKNRRAGELRKEAKLTYEQLMLSLEKNRDKLVHSLYHEIIHASRHGHIKSPSIPQDQATRKRILKTYVNHPPELDAHFLTVAHHILQSGENFTNFGEFLNKFRDMIGRYHFDLLSKKNRKKMINRLYQIYAQSEWKNV